MKTEKDLKKNAVKFRCFDGYESNARIRRGANCLFVKFVVFACDKCAGSI